MPEGGFLEADDEQTGRSIGPVAERRQAPPSRAVRRSIAVGAIATVLLVAIGRSLRTRDGGRPPRTMPFLLACAAAFRTPPAPRPLPWVVVKRRRPRLRDGYGHWWVELDGVESYGWWPSPCPVWLHAAIRGTGGTLNNDGRSKRRRRVARRDPQHGTTADHEFHPVVAARRSDWQVRRDLRRFAQDFEGGWRWSVRRPAANCRSFQLALLAAAGLVEDDRHLSSRGGGCWFLAPFRAARCRLRDPGRSRDVLHQLGGLCGCPPLHIPPL